MKLTFPRALEFDHSITVDFFIFFIYFLFGSQAALLCNLLLKMLTGGKLHGEHFQLEIFHLNRIDCIFAKNYKKTQQNVKIVDF